MQYSLNRCLWWLAGAVLAMATVPTAMAQQLPVTVSVSGNQVQARIGLPGQPLADLNLSFDDASGLTAQSLGLRAELVSTSSTTLRARLPDAGLISLADGLPLLITIEPPPGGTLSFRRRVQVEVHTHALVYSAGSPYRLFKAPLNGPFRDITSAVTPGSVRTRGHTGGFSQFLVVADLRPSRAVIAGKLDWLRNEASRLAPDIRNPIEARLDAIADSVQTDSFAAAMALIDLLRADVAAAAGYGIPELWRAGGSGHNSAGELLSGLDTLAFSIGFLRDFGS